MIYFSLRRPVGVFSPVRARSRDSRSGAVPHYQASARHARLALPPCTKERSVPALPPAHA